MPTFLGTLLFFGGIAGLIRPRWFLLVLFIIAGFACSGGGADSPMSPPVPQNQPPSLAVDVTIEDQNNTEATVRIVGSATDTDGTVVGITCQGDFTGTFGPNFDETQVVTKLEGGAQNFGTTCVATDNQGATASVSDGIQIAAAVIVPDPILFSGTGSAVSSIFALEGGFIVFASQHSGNSNFIVWLLDDQGARVELIANKIGDYEGVRGFSIPQGQFLLEVNADGSWEVVILQPRDDTGTNPPASIDANGDAVVGPIQLSSGLATFAWQHTGDSNFIVWLFRSDGARIDLLVNEIGDTTGSTAVNIPSTGIYYLDVQSEGSWTIAVD